MDSDRSNDAVTLRPRSTHRSTSCGNLRRPHWTKTSTVWCCLLLRVAAFLASENTGMRWKRYRPRVRPTWEPKGTKRIAQKSKLRLTPEVLATLASQGRDHRLTASGFFPCSIDNTCMDMLRMDTARSLVVCFPQWKVPGPSSWATRHQGLLPSSPPGQEAPCNSGHPLLRRSPATSSSATGFGAPT